MQVLKRLAFVWDVLEETDQRVLFKNFLLLRPQFPLLRAMQGANYSDQDADAAVSHSYCYSHEYDQQVQVARQATEYSPTHNYLLLTSQPFLQLFISTSPIQTFCAVRFRLLQTHWLLVGRYWFDFR
jgi:hypothetical protein